MPWLRLRLLSRLCHLSCSGSPILLHLPKFLLAQSPLKMESGREEVPLVQEEEVFVNRLKGERKLAQGTKKDQKRLESYGSQSCCLSPNMLHHGCGSKMFGPSLTQKMMDAKNAKLFNLVPISLSLSIAMVPSFLNHTQATAHVLNPHLPGQSSTAPQKMFSSSH